MHGKILNIPVSVEQSASYLKERNIHVKTPGVVRLSGKFTLKEIEALAVIHTSITDYGWIEELLVNSIIAHFYTSDPTYYAVISRYGISMADAEAYCLSIENVFDTGLVVDGYDFKDESIEIAKCITVGGLLCAAVLLFWRLNKAGIEPEQLITDKAKRSKLRHLVEVFGSARQEISVFDYRASIRIAQFTGNASKTRNSLLTKKEL